jgi:indole-3-glycerol phosphate synthase
MKDVKEIVISKSIPVLRKDFILDKYQIFQSRAFGADAVLLIVSMLTKEKLQELFELTQSLWMQSIVEIHDETELETALEVGAEIIGINNRNLHNFITDIEVTEQLAPKIPNGKIIVSESGIKNINDINRIQKAGVNAALIGESLISSKNIATKLKEFIND